MFARIAVSSAVYWTDRPYDYNIPAELTDKVLPGVRVVVPFGRGNRRVEGLVLAIADTSAYDSVKNIASVLDGAPVMSNEQIKLALWMRERFFCTIYSAVKAILPAGLWFSLQAGYRVLTGVDKPAAYEAAGDSPSERTVLDVLFAKDGVCSAEELSAAFVERDPAQAINSLIKKGIIDHDIKEKRRVGDKSANFVALAIPTEDAMETAAQKKRRAPQQSAILELLCAVGSAAVAEITYFTGAAAGSIKSLAKAGLVEISAREIYRRPSYKTSERIPLPLLNADQQAAFDGIMDLTRSGDAKAALLFGVTGSGKTSVYVRIIEEMRQQGKNSIMLVPEIALTPQMLSTFSAYFGDEIAVLHSSLSMGERYDEYKRVKIGQAKVVIGTRSAVFAPVSDLGAIIIDEEQESSYKSENSPRYHARDVAKYLCAKSKALLLLGSATPDIESRYSAQAGRYSYFSLPTRYNLMKLPDVRIVDMKRELRNGTGGSISSVLRDELEKNINAGEQSILFLNRRGASKLITCVDCGYTYQCPNCSVSMTFHRVNGRLMCHYCGYSQKAGDECPECGGTLGYFGAGTQMIEQELTELFPDVAIIRMDTDTVAPVGSHEALLSKFSEERIPIMIGTQMVTKGLNFNNVTLVGVISADQSLYSGDYRAGERTFSLITQVIGRSGRGDRVGRAIIQTFTPGNSTILQAASQDYESFYEDEIALRELQVSPPFCEMLVLTATGINEANVLRCCTAIRDILRKKLDVGEKIRILGPAPLSVVRVSNRFRYRVTLCSDGGAEARRLISDLLIYCNTAKQFRGVSVFADYGAGE